MLQLCLRVVARNGPAYCGCHKRVDRPPLLIPGRPHTVPENSKAVIQTYYWLFSFDLSYDWSWDEPDLLITASDLAKVWIIAIGLATPYLEPAQKRILAPSYSV